MKHAVARQSNMVGSGHFLKLRPSKVAPRCSKTAVPKSKSLKVPVSGRFGRFKLRFAWQVWRFRQVAKCVACAGISCFLKLMFQASDAESVRGNFGLWKCDFAGIISPGKSGARMPRLTFFLAQYC